MPRWSWTTTRRRGRRSAPHDHNWYDFDILAAGIDAAGLSGALDDPNADLTVFIPNDRAFQALVADLYGPRCWFAGEARILEKLVELETSAPGTLRTVILYHAVSGQIDSRTARWRGYGLWAVLVVRGASSFVR